MNLDEAQTDRQDQANFLSLAETLSSLIALIQGDKLICVNPAGCALLGRPKEFFIGRNFWDVVYPADREAAVARGRARLAGIPQPRRLIERLVHADSATTSSTRACITRSTGRTASCSASPCPGTRPARAACSSTSFHSEPGASSL